MIGEPDVVVPDVIEPIIGHRSWTVLVHPSGEPRLCSPFRRSPWEPGAPHEARCGVATWSSPIAVRPVSAAPPAHAAPQEGCTCGVHAWRSRETALMDAAGARGLRAVSGDVALWGTVLRHERGWRAARGYPSSLAVHAATDDGLCFVFSWLSGQLRAVPAEDLAPALAEAYGVPVAIDPGTNPLGPRPRHAPAARRIAPALLGAPAPEVERCAPRRTLRRRLASRLGGSG
jgi:hypothetical protein